MQYTAQKDYYSKEFPHATHEIICMDGSPIGRFYVDRQPDPLHILDITVLPQHRGRGADGSCHADFCMMPSKPRSMQPSTKNPLILRYSFSRGWAFHRDREDAFQLLMKFQAEEQ